MNKTQVLQAPSHNSLGIWNVVNKVSTEDLRTIYKDTFVIIFAAIEVSLVHVFFDTLDFTSLADTPLVDFWELKGCRERSDRCRPC